MTFVPECVGAVAEAALGRVPFGEAALMENLRFHADGRRGNRAFALRLSALGDGFIVTGPVASPPAPWIPALAELLPPVALDLPPSKGPDVMSGSRFASFSTTPPSAATASPAFNINNMEQGWRSWRPLRPATRP